MKQPEEGETDKALPEEGDSVGDGKQAREGRSEARFPTAVQRPEEAWFAGHQAGIRSARRLAADTCHRLMAELEAGRASLTPEVVEEMEARFASAGGSPVVTARFEGAAGALLTAQLELMAVIGIESAVGSVPRRKPALTLVPKWKGSGDEWRRRVRNGHGERGRRAGRRGAWPRG